MKLRNRHTTACMSGNNQNTIMLHPHTMQFVINELPWLLLCAAGFIYAGIDNQSLSGLALSTSFLFSLCLAYRFIYLKRISYRIGEEQLICEHGVLQRSVDYMELYRVVDFYEHQNFVQQLFGLKTVSIYSMDRNTPKLDLIGLPSDYDAVSLIRERVETNKERKHIYEVTNR